MSELRYKTDLELHEVGDGRTFLNFWNYQNGDDYVVEVKDGKLFHDNDEVTIGVFIYEVNERMKTILTTPHNDKQN